MIRVWAIAKVPTTATCCVMSDRLFAKKNRGLMMPKMAMATSSTIAGLSAGYRCIRLRIRLSGVLRSRNSVARSVEPPDVFSRGCAAPRALVLTIAPEPRCPVVRL